MNLAEKTNKQKMNMFLVSEFLLCGLIVLATTRQQTAIASAAFTASFVLVMFCFGKRVLFDKRRHLLTMVLGIIVETAACILCSALLTDTTITITYLTNYGVFLSTILFLFIVMNTESTEKTCRVILIFNVFLAYLYPIAYRFFSVDDQRGAYLYLNFSNPNLTAMWLLQSVLYAVVAMWILKAPLLKLMALLSVPLNIWLMGKTEARNSIVALILFGLMCVWIVFKRSPRFSKAAIVGVNVFPSAFVVLYLTYVDVVMEKGWFAFLTAEGKSLDSRVWVWQDRFEKMKGLWLIGNYAEAGGNAHNDHMVLLCSFGIFGLVLVVWYLCSICFEVNAESNGRKNLLALAAFFSVIFMGLGEGGLYSGGMGIFVMACGFLYVARCDFGTDPASAVLRQEKKRD